MTNRAGRDEKQWRNPIAGNSPAQADNALGPTSEAHLERQVDPGKTDPVVTPRYHEDDDIQAPTKVDPLKSQLTET